MISPENYLKTLTTVTPQPWMVVLSYNILSHFQIQWLLRHTAKYSFRFETVQSLVNRILDEGHSISTRIENERWRGLSLTQLVQRFSTICKPSKPVRFVELCKMGLCFGADLRILRESQKNSGHNLYGRWKLFAVFGARSLGEVHWLVDFCN